MSKMTAHEWEIAYGQLEDEHKATLSRIESAIAWIVQHERVYGIYISCLKEILEGGGSDGLSKKPEGGA